MPDKKHSKRSSSTKPTAGHSSHTTAASRARASSVQPPSHSSRAIRSHAQASKSAQQSRHSSSSSQQAEPSASAQRTKHSSSSQQARPSSSTQKTKPSSSAQQTKYSSLTQQAKASTSAQKTKPSSSTPHAKPSASAQKTKASSSAQKTKSSTTPQQTKASSSTQKAKGSSSAQQTSSSSRSITTRSRISFSILPPREEPPSSTHLPSHRSIRPAKLHSILKRTDHLSREEVSRTIFPSRTEGKPTPKGNKNGWVVVYKEATKKWYRIKYSKLAEDVETDLVRLETTETVRITGVSTNPRSEYGTWRVLQLPGHIKRAKQRGAPYSWIFVDREKAGKDNYKSEDKIDGV
ncbi:uncharacterized protein PAC_11269 [Phialocephala subalpina]|uniref:Uncharacterized protein n=1 Tax=Phialocephala subalpina TaxID=576137 RepID=A0A1L7X8M3_9HELO|nr:uncharacterized protein PAC_11269 [Phialocephala subalpina]